MKRVWQSWAVALLMASAVAQAVAGDGLAALQSFVREVRTGSAEFTQTVIAPDGVRKRVSSGTFEFSRPDRFRFAYTKPFEQLILADGQRLWIYDPDLNQVIARKQSQALAATPAALLAGTQLDRNFQLAVEPSTEGLDWVKATPKSRDAGFDAVRLGFRSGTLAQLEILDGLGQRSVLQFHQLKLNAPLPVDRMVFTVPKGAEVVQQ